MNNDVNVECLAERVGGDTEHVFTDTFFNQLHGVANALDNVEARMLLFTSLFCKICVYL
jgi:ubiquitin-activating enzyme E1